jgi:hypothetical protein
MNDRQLKNTVIGFALGVSGFSLAAVSIPNTFTAGTPIVAAQVNANFTALKTALETAAGINDGAIGASKLNVTGAAADGKVLKLSGGNLSWGDDLTGGGGAAYSAGEGLALAANTFSVNFAGSGAANTVSRSDHNHFGQSWSGPSGQGLTVNLTTPGAVSSQAALVGRVGSVSTWSSISGVWGDSADKVGVFGSSNTNRGVTGASQSGEGVAGISTNGTGVLAYSSAGTALRIEGPIKVAGARSPAFVHTALAGNISGNTTVIDNPLTNDQPNAILIITPRYESVYNPNPTGVFYLSGKWIIHNINGAAVPVNAKFNVLVFQQ